MGDYRKRPKGRYLKEADWADLYHLCKNWRSGLAFYKDDLRFLHHLIDKYFIWMIKKDNVDEVRKIEKNLLEVDKKCEDLLQKTNKHMVHIESLVENPKSMESRIFRMEHEHLEDEISDFIELFRINKKEIFGISEHFVDIKKLQYLKT